ncbi:hypothetical protein PENTCL1PPCAC_8185, partial [Pristionchus entomophagus]
DTHRGELNKMLKRLHEAIQRHPKMPMNSFRLRAFGSSENGFGSNQSDFHVCFRYEKNFNGTQLDRNQVRSAIGYIEYALGTDDRFTNVKSILTAKVCVPGCSITNFDCFS